MNFFKGLKSESRSSRGEVSSRAVLKRAIHDTRKLLFDYQSDNDLVLTGIPFVGYIEFAPGCFAKGVELEHNGMSVIIWEIPQEYDMPEHMHKSCERLSVLRGRLEVRLYERTCVLTAESAPIFVPANTPHSGRTLSNGDQTVIVTTYTPALSIKDALTAV